MVSNAEQFSKALVPTSKTLLPQITFVRDVQPKKAESEIASTA